MSNVSSTRSRASTIVEPSDNIGSIACKYWKLNLKPHGWYFSKGGRDDWRFIPKQYGTQKISDLKKAGAEEGVHYADGWVSLYNMLRKYGRFSENETNEFGQPQLLDYKGPTLSNIVVGSDEDEEDTQLEVNIFQGSVGIREKITSKLSEDVWGQENFVPYRYLEKVLADEECYIFVGSLNGGRICSLFAFCFTGLKKTDACIKLEWTKHEYRRRGFITKLTHEAICFLVDDAILSSGETTPNGALVCRSQGFKELSKGMFCSSLGNLRKAISLSLKGKTKLEDNTFDWSFVIPAAEVDDEGNDIIAVYGKCCKRKKESSSEGSSKKRKRSESSTSHEFKLYKRLEALDEREKHFVSKLENFYLKELKNVRASIDEIKDELFKS